MNSRRSFYVTEASSNKTFKNVLRSQKSDKFFHRETLLAPVKSIVDVKKYRNFSTLDPGRSTETSFTGKKAGEFGRNMSSSDIFNVKNTLEVCAKNQNAFSPEIKHKRMINTIAKNNPEVKKDGLELKKLYEGNTSYTGTTAGWNINTTDKLNSSKTKKNIISESKSKFLSDVLGRNPLKQISYKEKIENDKDKRQRNYSKFLSVSNILGSNQLKKSLSYKDAGSINDNRVNKVTNSHYDPDQAQRLNSAERKGVMKFRHLYDGRKGFYI